MYLSSMPPCEAKYCSFHEKSRVTIWTLWSLNWCFLVLVSKSQTITSACNPACVFCPEAMYFPLGLTLITGLFSDYLIFYCHVLWGNLVSWIRHVLWLQSTREGKLNVRCLDATPARHAHPQKTLSLHEYPISSSPFLLLFKWIL